MIWALAHLLNSNMKRLDQDVKKKNVTFQLKIDKGSGMILWTPFSSKCKHGHMWSSVLTQLWNASWRSTAACVSGDAHWGSSPWHLSAVICHCSTHSSVNKSLFLDIHGSDAGSNQKIFLLLKGIWNFSCDGFNKVYLWLPKTMG